MPRLMRMPEVAANSVEAVLQSWALADGATFAALDTLATIETEKAVVDVDAEGAGVLLHRLVEPGATVEVGAPIALIGDPGELVPDIAAALAALGVGVAPPAGVAAAAVAADPVNTLATPAKVATNSAPVRVQGRIFASPLARRLAREAGIDPAAITGTGPGGRILRRDVAAATQTQVPAVAAPASVPVEPPSAGVATPAVMPTKTPAPVAVPQSAYTDIPNSRMRQAIARRLTESKQQVPHFYLRGTCRVDNLLAAREQLNAVSPVRISVNDLLIKAIGWAHVLVPAVNVTWGGDHIRHFTSVDVSVAIATERGLVTPVVRGVETIPIGQVAAKTKDLAERARAGRLQQDELEGGTISISNLGMYGTEEFAAIINPPQAAILAVGAAAPEPIVVDGRIEVATVMRVTLSVDHRSVDGALGADWLRTFKELVENPIRLLA